MNRNPSNISIIFLIIPITWAGSFIAAKYVVAEISPIESVFWRFLLSAIIMFPFLIVSYRKSHPDLLNVNFIRHMTIVVLTSGVIYHVFFFMGLQYTSPTNAALIIALNPFFTAFGEILVFKKLRTNRFYIGFGMAFGGALWVIISRGDGISAPGIGELFCLIASLSWSVYTIAAKRTKDTAWNSLWIGAYNYLLTALLVLPFILNKINLAALEEIPFVAWTGLWYMAIFPTVIGYTLYYIGVQKKGPAWAASYIYLVPSFTANRDYIFFSARFTLPMVIGTTMVVAGLITGNMSQNQINKWLNRKTQGRQDKTP